MITIIKEAYKNIRTNILLNLAIVGLLISVMTFLGIIAVQVQISDISASVVLNQEAFVELSQYHFVYSQETVNRITQRLDINTGELIPEEEMYIWYPLSKNPLINMQYVANSDRLWEFMRKLKSIPGVYYYSVKQGSFLTVGQHDAYIGHYVPDSTKDFAVSLDFFDIENLTFLKGRAPEEDDFYIDENGVQVVPVVVGYQLRDEFELGDIVAVKGRLDNYDPNDLKNRIVFMSSTSKGIVVGVLDKSNTTTSSHGNSLLDFSCAIIRAVRDPSPDLFPELRSSDDIYVFASWEQLLTIPSSKLYINKTNEEQAAEEIRQALIDSGIDSFYSVAKCDSYAKIVAAVEKGRTESYLHVALCVGILSLLGLGVLIVMLNIANAKDYAIHRLVGAAKNDIAIMSTVQMLILLLVSDVLIHYPYFLSKTGLFLNGDSMLYIFSGERKIYVVIAVLNIAVLLLTYIISRVLASGTDISNEIKDKE